MSDQLFCQDPMLPQHSPVPMQDGTDMQDLDTPDILMQLQHTHTLDMPPLTTDITDQDCSIDYNT